MLLLILQLQQSCFKRDRIHIFFAWTCTCFAVSHHARRTAFPEAILTQGGLYWNKKTRMYVTLTVWTSVSLIRKELMQRHDWNLVLPSSCLSEPYLTAHIISYWFAAFVFFFFVIFTVPYMVLWCTCPKTNPHFTAMPVTNTSFEWVKAFST